MTARINSFMNLFVISALFIALMAPPSHADTIKYSDEFEYLKEQYDARAHEFCSSGEIWQKARDAVSRYFVANKNGGDVPPRSFGTSPIPLGYTAFFNKHCIYRLDLTDWADNKRYDYLAAVNLETGEGTVYYIRLLDHIQSKKLLDVSSYMRMSYELNIDNLNKFIESDDIEINDLNLRAYVKYAIVELLFFREIGYVIFDRNSTLCQPNPYLKEEYDPNSLYGSAMIGLRELRAYMAPYCLGSGMSVYKLDGGAYAVHLVTWSEIMGYISEWDFTIARNGTIHIYEIKDIDSRVGSYIELKDDKDK